MKLNIVLYRQNYLNNCILIVLFLVSCGAPQQNQPPSIESDGGGGQFFEGQKEETSNEDTSNSQSQEFQIDTVCPGALTSKLSIGDNARIIIYQLKARTAPGFSSYSEHTLAEGRVVEIIHGPVCADSGWWWYIHFSGTISTGDYLDFYAWMVEVDYDTYYLSKIN